MVVLLKATGTFRMLAFWLTTFIFLLRDLNIKDAADPLRLLVQILKRHQ